MALGKPTRAEEFEQLRKQLRWEREDALSPKEFVKHDSSKNPLHLLPTVALERVGEVLDFGQKKYAPNNWRKIDKRSRYYSAVLRHLFAYNRGENLDPETNLKHLAHAACSLLFLLESEELGYGEDDRPTTAPITSTKEDRSLEEAEESREWWIVPNVPLGPGIEETQRAFLAPNGIDTVGIVYTTKDAKKNNTWWWELRNNEAPMVSGIANTKKEAQEEAEIRFRGSLGKTEPYAGPNGVWRRAGTSCWGTQLWERTYGQLGQCVARTWPRKEQWGWDVIVPEGTWDSGTGSEDECQKAAEAAAKKWMER